MVVIAFIIAVFFIKENISEATEIGRAAIAAAQEMAKTKALAVGGGPA